MKRLNDEELSRVLSAHAADELRYVDQTDMNILSGGCLVQQATTIMGRFPDNARAQWFDGLYTTEKNVPTEDFLKILEFAGLA